MHSYEEEYHYMCKTVQQYWLLLKWASITILISTLVGCATYIFVNLSEFLFFISAFAGGTSIALMALGTILLSILTAVDGDFYYFWGKVLDPLNDRYNSFVEYYNNNISTAKLREEIAELKKKLEQQEKNEELKKELGEL